MHGGQDSLLPRRYHIGFTPPCLSDKRARMFLLAHITDPHLGPLPRLVKSDATFKRRIGYFNWHRNRAHAFSDEVLAAHPEEQSARVIAFFLTIRGRIAG